MKSYFRIKIKKTTNFEKIKFFERIARFLKKIDAQNRDFVNLKFFVKSFSLLISFVKKNEKKKFRLKLFFVRHAISL